MLQSSWESNSVKCVSTWFDDNCCWPIDNNNNNSKNRFGPNNYNNLRASLYMSYIRSFEVALVCIFPENRWSKHPTKNSRYPPPELTPHFVGVGFPFSRRLSISNTVAISNREFARIHRCVWLMSESRHVCVCVVWSRVTETRCRRRPVC